MKQLQIVDARHGFLATSTVKTTDEGLSHLLLTRGLALPLQTGEKSCTLGKASHRAWDEKKQMEGVIEISGELAEKAERILSSGTWKWKSVANVLDSHTEEPPCVSVVCDHTHTQFTHRRASLCICRVWSHTYFISPHHRGGVFCGKKNTSFNEVTGFFCLFCLQGIFQRFCSKKLFIENISQMRKGARLSLIWDFGMLYNTDGKSFWIPC